MAVLEPFSQEEFPHRLTRTQKGMRAAGLDAILVSSLANFRYYSGYTPIIAESPARPWFVILPAEGAPIAVIPHMGLEDMRAASWIERIEHWPSPRPADEGVSLLASAVEELPVRHGKIGAELGPETRLGMPQTDFAALSDACSASIVDASEILRQVRAIKSEAEIDRIRKAGACAGEAFAGVANWLKPGMSEREVHRRFQAELLTAGVDYVRYLSMGSGQGGYSSICRGPIERTLGEGDILALDTGAIVDGYFCDFDRNYALGHTNEEAQRAYDILYKAIEAGLAAAAPGQTCAELWGAMNEILEKAGVEASSIGRMGHGLGLALTEQPSLHPDDLTVIEQGMVLTLEPGLLYKHDGAQHLMVHEENIVIGDGGATLLSPRATAELVVI
ncbi:MAG: M24 family metallopeptidase [Hyphomicrobiales bacterium]